MKKMKLGKSKLEVPRIAVGCMRMSQRRFEKSGSFYSDGHGAWRQFF